MNTTFDVGNYTSHVKCDGPCNILAKPKEMDYKVVLKRARIVMAAPKIWKETNGKCRR